MYMWGGSWNGSNPKIIHFKYFKNIFCYKPSILGYLHLRKPSYIPIWLERLVLCNVHNEKLSTSQRQWALQRQAQSFLPLPLTGQGNYQTTSVMESACVDSTIRNGWLNILWRGCNQQQLWWLKRRRFQRFQHHLDEWRITKLNAK